MSAFTLLDIDMANVLGFLFIGIFALTALLTLLSLPGWVDIGEWYRKKLFLALIIEVVALVLLIGKDVLLPKHDTDEKVLAQIGSNVNLRPTVRSEGELSIISPDSVTLGRVPVASLQRLNLFSRINSSANASEKNDIVKWESAKGGGKWKPVRGKEIANSPFSFEVKDVPGKGTVYIITNTVTGEERFNSGTYQDEVLNDNERLTHFYKHENTYCLFRIVSSVLITTAEKRNVDVLQVKIDPALVSGDLKVTRDHSRRNPNRDSSTRDSSGRSRGDRR